VTCVLLTILVGGGVPDRCKQAECERQKEELASVKLEISLLQRRAGTTASAPSGPPSIVAIEDRTLATVAATSDSPASNLATWGSPDDTKRSDPPTASTEDKSQKEEST
jgi:hypothetical protein